MSSRDGRWVVVRVSAGESLCSPADTSNYSHLSLAAQDVGVFWWGVGCLAVRGGVLVAGGLAQVQPGRPRVGESAQEARVRYGLNMAAQAVRVEERLAAHRADLAHWQAVRARQVAEGTATDFGRHNVAAGDRVRVRDVWYPVVRANVKTVTVFGMFGPRTTPWHEVQAHQQAPQQAADGAQDVAGDGAGQQSGRATSRG